MWRYWELLYVPSKREEKPFVEEVKLFEFVMLLEVVVSFEEVLLSEKEVKSLELVKLSGVVVSSKGEVKSSKYEVRLYFILQSSKMKAIIKIDVLYGYYKFLN